ncbi:MAG TPA: flagellar hook-associated protein FlgK [Chthonomonadales bacterium]|nr:flagellar hook-associated protein FlgK [Chthonomonadales bacterium]
MRSTFGGVEIASRALQANQTAINVVGHNVANVNTPGFTRQRVQIVAADPYTVPSLVSSRPGQIGTGVEIAAVTRARDELMRQRLQDVVGGQGMLTEMRDLLERVQAVYAEPTSGGLSNLLTQFFSSWQQLSVQPENHGVRTAALQSAHQLTAQMSNAAGSLDQLQRSMSNRLDVVLGEVNRSAQEVAALNGQIRLSISAGERPNDLLDRRDALLRRLGELIGAKSHEQATDAGISTGTVTVTLNGFALVQDTHAVALPTEFLLQDGVPYLTANNQRIAVTEGIVGGVLRSTALIEQYRDELDAIARTLIEQVNGLHAAGYGLDGYTGRLFFAGAGAHDMAVHRDVNGRPERLAAASPPDPGQAAAPGNGNNARSIAGIGTQRLFGTNSLIDQYNANVARVGADLQSVTTQAENRARLVEQLDHLRSSVEGVSLDEEMTRMLTFQRSYQAAARLMVTLDDMLDRLINGLIR